MTDGLIPHRTRPKLYHGWLVVAAAFLVATYGFGLGFYGVGVYLVTLNALHGWPIAQLSTAITAYYVLGATVLFCFVGSLYERYGARKIVLLGAAALAGGALLLPMAGQLWHIYASFAVMSVGWAAMSGAGINIIVAPWFERHRGVAVSWAMNGASAGGVLFVPLLTMSIAAAGFATTMAIAAAAMLVVLVPVSLLLRPKRPDEYEPTFGIAPALQQTAPNIPSSDAPPLRLARVMRGTAFITVSAPFALALAAQVGFLTHQMAFLSATMGTVAVGWLVSLTNFAAVLGRIATGYIADRFDRRAVACGNFMVQALGLGFLAAVGSSTPLYVGCVLFGLGVGNTASLPGLLVQQEFPKQHFVRIVSAVVAINQFTFAFGPMLLGELERIADSYLIALAACVLMELLAAAIVASPLVLRRMLHAAEVR